MDLERDDAALRTAAGRVTLVLPEGPCLHRAGVLVADEVSSATAGNIMQRRTGRAFRSE